jgi:hypothetical protein
LTLVVEGPDGTVSPLDLTGPGGVERLAMGDPGNRSAVWRFWANRNSSCVYVGVRTLTGAQKYSFHQSGIWRLAWATRDEALRYTGSPDRLIDRWSRPPDRLGWTPALTIWVPHGELSPTADADRPSSGAQFLPAPKPGKISGLQLMIVRPNLGIVTLRRALPVCGFALRNNEAAIVVLTVQGFDAEQATWIDEHRARARAVALRRVGKDLSATRMALYGATADGSRFVYDLSLHR